MPPQYLALLPDYLAAPARHELLQALRVRLRNRYGAATALAYGPRYLHSTGQLPKGGPNTGTFLRFAADAPADIPVPGQPWGFATLQRAQAIGDFQALRSKERRVLRIDLGRDIENGFRKVASGNFWVTASM